MMTPEDRSSPTPATPRKSGRKARYTKEQVVSALLKGSLAEVATQTGWGVNYVRILQRTYGVAAPHLPPLDNSKSSWPGTRPEDPHKVLLQGLIAGCATYSELATRSGLSRAMVWRKVRKFGLDASHFPKYEILNPCVDIRRKGKITPGTFAIHPHRIGGLRVRRAMLLDGFKDECAECGQGPVWNGKPLRLQVDHRNGNHCDNRRENLRFLCANCHTQTETFCNRNRHSYGA